MELALGTVQWGMAYGIAGRGSPVPEAEVRSILSEAWRCGVHTLDTAAAYGDIEERLLALTGGMPFRIVSKIPALPAGLADADGADWALAHARRSRERLGEQLQGLMFHQVKDLAGPRGAAVWSTVGAWAERHGVKLGASVYDPRAALELHRERGIALTQVPGNAFDQRIAHAMPAPVPGLEVHLRSAFLQGLLLMAPSAAAARLPAAAGALQRWHAWCARRELPPLVAALSLAKSFRAVASAVLGVDSADQFADIARAWASAQPVRADELACDAAEIIDPRLWNLAP